VDYIREHLVKRRLDSSNEEMREARNVPDPLDKKVVGFRVEVLSSDLQDIYRQEQVYRIGQRQLFLARLLALVVAGLAAIATYLRLDEATKGYYTTLLRVGSIALVAMVGAGLWWLA